MRLPGRRKGKEPPATESRPEQGRTLSFRERVFQRHLQTLEPGHLLDIATGHGLFAIIARDLGWKVTAMDVRDSRFPDANGIDWVTADIRDFDLAGYDCISNLGLLYHLELEDVIDLLARCAPTPMILDTHISIRPNRRERGFAGHVFREVPGDDPEVLAATPTASWGNTTSYWLTEESLIMLLHEVGYQNVWRLTPRYEHDRTFYWCV